MHSYFFAVQLAHSYYPKQSISVCTISTNPLLVTLYFSKPGINSPNNWPKEPKEWGIVRLDLQFLDAFWLSKECHTETSLQLHTQHIHGASSMYSNIHYPGFKDFKDKLLLKTSRKKKKLIPKEHQNHHLSPNYTWFWLIGNPHFECDKLQGQTAEKAPIEFQTNQHGISLGWSLLGWAFHSAAKKNMGLKFKQGLFIVFCRGFLPTSHIYRYTSLVVRSLSEKLPKRLLSKINSESLTLPIYPFCRQNMLWGAGKLELLVSGSILWFRF